MRNGFPERAESSRVGIIIGIIYQIGFSTFTNVIAGSSTSSSWFPLRACIVWNVFGAVSLVPFLNHGKGSGRQSQLVAADVSGNRSQRRKSTWN